MDPVGGLNDGLSRLVQPYGTLGAMGAAPAQVAHRDIAFERRLLQQGSPRGCAQRRPHPRAGSPVGGARVRGRDSWRRRAASARLHDAAGRVPRHARDSPVRGEAGLRCRGARQLRVLGGHELPVEQQSAIDAYLSNQAAPVEVERLTSQEFWRRPYQDGRSSEAMLGLLAEVKRLRAAGLYIDVRALEDRGLSGDVKDSLMAERLLAPLMTDANAVVTLASSATFTPAPRKASPGTPPTVRWAGGSPKRDTASGRWTPRLRQRHRLALLRRCQSGLRQSTPRRARRWAATTLVKVWGERSREWGSTASSM